MFLEEFHFAREGKNQRSSRDWASAGEHRYGHRYGQWVQEKYAYLAGCWISSVLSPGTGDLLLYEYLRPWQKMSVFLCFVF